MTLKCCAQDRKLHLPAVTDYKEHNFQELPDLILHVMLEKREILLEAKKICWLIRAQSTLVFPSSWSSFLCKHQPFSICQFWWQFIVSQQQHAQLRLSCETAAHKSSQHGQSNLARAARQSKSCKGMFGILSSWELSSSAAAFVLRGLCWVITGIVCKGIRQHKGDTKLNKHSHGLHRMARKGFLLALIYNEQKSSDLSNYPSLTALCSFCHSGFLLEDT